MWRRRACAAARVGRHYSRGVVVHTPSVCHAVTARWTRLSCSRVANASSLLVLAGRLAQRGSDGAFVCHTQCGTFPVNSAFQFLKAETNFRAARPNTLSALTTVFDKGQSTLCVHRPTPRRVARADSFLCVHNTYFWILPRARRGEQEKQQHAARRLTQRAHRQHPHA